MQFFSAWEVIAVDGGVRSGQWLIPVDRIDAWVETLSPEQTANAVGLDLDDLFQERIRHLSHYLTHEECYFVLWTRPSVLTKTELQRSAKELKAKKWINAGYGQNPLAALDPLRNRHKSFISALTGAFGELSLKVEVIESHDALRLIRDNLYPNKANENWRACVPGDPIPPRAPTSQTDLSDVIWPPLRQQLSAGDARVLSNSVVQIGDLVWAAADMTLGPMDASPFPMLLNRLFEANIPYRISFLIEGGGVQAMALRTFAATILGVTNVMNKQIKYSLEGLEGLSRKEPVVKLRISFATWAPKNQVELVEDLGDTAVLDLDCAGTLLRVRVSDENVPREGDTISIAARPQDIHLFDPATGKRL